MYIESDREEHEGFMLCFFLTGNRAPQTSAHLPRDIPSHYSLLPRYPANYSPRDIAGMSL